ncbi:dynamin-like 120 kDa protein, mitochondrial isoform X6, partial [Tachysurus ichikawai]
TTGEPNLSTPEIHPTGTGAESSDKFKKASGSAFPLLLSLLSFIFLTAPR